jgi:hypothetical protein
MTSRPAFYGQNNNQNYFTNDGKTSSRVLQAPGGSSSISLSWNVDNDTNDKNEGTSTILPTCILLSFLYVCTFFHVCLVWYHISDIFYLQTIHKNGSDSFYLSLLT